MDISVQTLDAISTSIEYAYRSSKELSDRLFIFVWNTMFANIFLNIIKKAVRGRQICLVDDARCLSDTIGQVFRQLAYAESPGLWRGKWSGITVVLEKSSVCRGELVGPYHFGALEVYSTLSRDAARSCSSGDFGE